MKTNETTDKLALQKMWYAGIALVAGLCLTGAAWATEYAITDTRKVVMTTDDVLVPAATALPIDALPDVGTPIFRFDAKVTTGWTFDAADASKVTGIPSLVGDRQLTMSGEGGDWSAFALVSPVLTADPTLGNQPCLDFGKLGSKQGLIFNAVDAKNELSGIGSVFMVFNSAEGGGTLLGGGSGLNGGKQNTYNMWLRGLTPNYPGSQWDNTNPYSFLIRYGEGGVGDEYGYLPAAMGRVYHDGLVGSPWLVGLNGGWEVVALQPTEATMVATGVGLGYGRTGMGKTSGGQRIAEMIIYGEVLSDANRAKVEAYLEKKWFGRTPRGWNDNAAVDLVRATKNVYQYYMTNGAEVAANVAEGQQLNIGKLFGGRGGYATFTKNGAGTLTIGDASAYQGTMHLNGGTLAFAKRAIPAALPIDSCAHFDASDASTLDYFVTNGVKAVRKWRSKSDFLLDGSKLCLAPNADYLWRVPWIRENVFSGGKAVVDFGYDADNLSGNHLVISQDAVPTKHVKLQGVTTVLAVVSPHSGAPYNVVGAFDNADPNASTSRSYFNTPSCNRMWHKSLFASMVLTKINPVLTGQDITMWVDGLRHDHTTGFMHPGWQVAAFSNPGSCVGSVGASAHWYYAAGNMAIAEIVMYARPLNEQEILDAQAYLMNKWFGREMPGYAKVVERTEVPDVQTVAIDADTALNVAAGTTVRLGTVKGAGTLVKTGAGTLEIEKNASAKIVLKGGRVKCAAAAEPASFKTMAKDPATHFDASDDDSFLTRMNGTLEQVWMWYDETGRNCAWMDYINLGAQPWINRTNTLNGMQVVDFGSMNSSRSLRFAVPLDGIKAAFVVWGSQNGGGTLLGSRTLHGWENDEIDDFRRIDNPKATDLILNENDTSQHVWGGQIYVNGVLKYFRNAVPSGDWDLVEVYPQGAAHASALAYSRKGALTGGQRLAEVILYERVLSDREKVATRNYLMQKWFGKTDEELTPLPDAPEAATVNIERIEVAADETVTLDGDTDYSVGEIVGAGEIVKAGAGTLAIGLAHRFTGHVQANGGCVKLTSQAAPKRATEGLKLWLDANAGVTMAADTTTQVTNWESQATTETPLSARGLRYGDAGMTAPTFVTGGPNGKPYMHFKRGSYFRFMKNEGAEKDELVRLTDMQTIFWVIGSQEGGGMLLSDSPVAGAGEKANTFRRSTRAGSSFPGNYADDPLLAASAAQVVKAADWRRNAEGVDPLADGLSGGWDVVSCNLKADATQAATADGLANVGGHRDNQWCCGFQNLAEVLIYNKRLSPEDVQATESYLAQKYGLSIGAFEVAFTNGLNVTLAEGVTLESAGRSRYVQRVDGVGAVEGDVTAGGFVADGDAGALTINGTLTIPSGVQVAVENLNASGWTPLAVATDYAGRENLASAVIRGTTAKVKLRIRKGVLGLAAMRGFTLMVK